MRIAVVDDEEYYLNALNDIIQREFLNLGSGSDSVDLFSTSDDFLNNYANGKYQLIFLDIYIDEKNGIDIARKIREVDENVTIVFCTTSNDFAAQSYEVDASYYLIKPLSEDKVKQMLKRVNTKELWANQVIVLPNETKIRLYDILFTEYNNHTVTFYFGDGLKSSSAYMSQKDAEDLLLEHNGFCIINRGTIVNFYQVDKMNGKTSLILKNGEELPISRGKQKEVAASYAKFRFNQLNESFI